ncbi:MAG: XRE family transcriptional regulator [Gammaproteobacteria bacterium]|nr:XRE family transcriptional regulator [Gammaproteobacteria bacterium]
MLSHRIKQLRLSRGLSQEALVAEMGGIVTKQSISKYERGTATPSALVLVQLARVLGVKSSALWGESACRVEFVAYRKHSGLGSREQVRVENLVRQALEERVCLQERVYGTREELDFPVRRFAVAALEDAEQAAQKMRELWNLGSDPIGNLVGVLEDRQVQVIEIDAPAKFDGISAFALDEDGRHLGAAVVSRRGVPGDRQRLNLAHELGHTVLEVAEVLDEEAAAFRFAGAFLAPRDEFMEEVGTHRRHIDLDELVLLKRKFGMSVQALLRRMRDLDIILATYYQQWCIDISRMGWRRSEPAPLPPEEPQWLRRTVLRGIAEGALTVEEGKTMLGTNMEDGERLEAIQRRAFLKLPMEERRRLLAAQAEAMVEHYAQDAAWRDGQGGDIHEFDD